MPGSLEPSRTISDDRQQIWRFSAGSRVVHWVIAIPFLLLLFSGLLLFLPGLKAIHIGGFRVLSLLHVVIGIAFILSPVLLYLLLPDRSEVIDDARRLFRIEQGDTSWASYAAGSLLGARVRMPPVGKFNFGQKVNTVFSLAIILGLMATGAVLAVNYFTKSVFSA